MVSEATQSKCLAAGWAAWTDRKATGLSATSTQLVQEAVSGAVAGLQRRTKAKTAELMALRCERGAEAYALQIKALVAYGSSAPFLCAWNGCAAPPGVEVWPCEAVPPPATAMRVVAAADQLWKERVDVHKFLAVAAGAGLVCVVALAGAVGSCRRGRDAREAARGGLKTV